MERRLGRGLGSLLGQKAEDGPQTGPVELPVDALRPNPFQPRTRFDEDSLRELAESIRLHGVLQPVVVRRAGAAFELVAGERRWRASKSLGLTTIPAVVRDELSDQQMLELALIENVQRAELDAIERARGFQQLIDLLHLTQEQVAERVALKRSTVANHLRLLELPKQVQEAVARGLLSMGHARALLALPAAKEQLRWMEKVVRDGLSVRQVEQLVKTESEARQAPSTGAKTLIPQAAWVGELEERLRRALGTKVKVECGPGYRGEVRIEFYQRVDLERIAEAIAPRPKL